MPLENGGAFQGEQVTGGLELVYAEAGSFCVLAGGGGMPFQNVL